MLQLGVPTSVEYFITFVIVLAIVCYLAVSLIIYTYSIYDRRLAEKLKRKQNQSVDREEVDEDQEVGNRKNSMAKIAPKQSPSRRNSTIIHAEQLHKEHLEYERRLHAMYARRSFQQSQHTQERVKARARLQGEEILGSMFITAQLCAISLLLQLIVDLFF